MKSIQNGINKDVGDYLIHLLASVLWNRRPEEIPQTVSFEALFYLAKYHCVESMAFYGIDQLNKKPEPELYQKWRQYRERNLLQSLTQISEKNAIIQNLFQAGIPVLPLKGCILKGLYPQEDYRQMADLDLLIPEDQALRAKEIMINLGYTSDHFEIGHHDSYSKKPYMGVELHRCLLPEKEKNWEYFKGIWDNVLPENPFSGSYRMRWEDFYLFQLMHFYKHYSESGSGIRSILDIAVFLSKVGTKLNKTYIDKEVKYLGLETFRKTAEELAGKWFLENEKTGMEQLSCSGELMAEKVMLSGVYGTAAQRVSNHIQELEQNGYSAAKAKCLFVIRRIFMDKKSMYYAYPFLRKAGFLLPFCLTHRIIYSLLFKRKRIRREWEQILKE